MWNVGGSDAGLTGRIWTATSNPDQVGPDWIGGPVFDESAPILVFRNPADSNRRITLMALALFVTNTPGGVSHFRVIADRIDRYVPLSGTLHVNGNSNAKLRLPATVSGAPPLTSLLEIYDELVDYEAASFTNTLARFDGNGTVAVAGEPLENDYGLLPAAAGAAGVFNFNGSLILEPGTTAAVYAWAATTAPQGRFAARWTEEVKVVS